MRCILCKHDRLVPFYDSLLQCNNCSLVVAQEAYAPLDAQNLYNSEYFFGIEYRDYIAEQRRFIEGFTARLRDIRKLVLRGKLLEIGCAYGFFLKVAQKDFAVTGIDISRDATDYAKNELKLPAICADFLRYKFSERSFDVICMWDTIEHLKRPDLYVAKAAKLLRPGGILCLTTGNIDRFLPKIQKEKWRLIHPPTHLFYFSLKTLTKLLKDNGLTVISETYPGSWRSVLHILYGLGMKSTFFTHLEKRLRRFSILNDIAIYYNAFDIMFLIAKKEKKEYR